MKPCSAMLRAALALQPWYKIRLSPPLSRSSSSNTLCTASCSLLMTLLMLRGLDSHMRLRADVAAAHAALESNSMDVMRYPKRGQKKPLDATRPTLPTCQLTSSSEPLAHEIGCCISVPRWSSVKARINGSVSRNGGGVQTPHTEGAGRTVASSSAYRNALSSVQHRSKHRTAITAQAMISKLKCTSKGRQRSKHNLTVACNSLTRTEARSHFAFTAARINSWSPSKLI